MVWQIVRDNIRASDLVVGDMDAQVAAARIGAERMAELVERYGVETFDLACTALMDHAERLMRQAIAKLPDGVYRAETAIDGYLDSDDRQQEGAADRRHHHQEGRLAGGRPHRHRAAGARPADQHAARRHRRHRDLAHHPLGAARHRDPRPHPGQCRPDPADHHRRAQGVPRQPDLPGADHRPLLPGQSARRHGDEGADQPRCPTTSRPASAI